tara:strand:- start:1158 stop:2066 length:909 start_codon:yes stop_codon:yes gene_type:complete
MNNDSDQRIGYDSYSSSSFKTVISMILLGYFATKLLQKLMITKDEEEITCYSNIQYDFMGVLLFGSIIYLFNSYLSELNSKSSILFIFSYIIGLTFGQIYSNFNNEKIKTGNSTGLDILSGLYYLLVIVVIVISLISNFEAPLKIAIYISFIIIFGGTLFFLNTYNTEFRKGSDTMAIFTNKFLLTVPTLAFLTNLLFLYTTTDNLFITTIQQFLSGILLGIFVSSVAIFGIRELIPERQQITCSDMKEEKLCKGKPFNYNTLYKNSKLATTALILLILAFLVIVILASTLIFSNVTKDLLY